MPEHIGNAGIKAMAWAERGSVTLGPQTKGKSSGTRTRRHPHLFVARADGDHVRAKADRPAPAKNETLTVNREGREELAGISETLEGGASALQIDTKEIAERVYRLMQHDLILERERTTKLGV